jgi:WD40 repeat protein
MDMQQGKGLDDESCSVHHSQACCHAPLRPDMWDVDVDLHTWVRMLVDCPCSSLNPADAAVEDLLGLPERVEEVLSDMQARNLAFNRYGTLLAVGAAGGTVVLIDYQTRGMAATLGGGHGADADVTAVLWSTDGRTLLSGASDGNLAEWDVAGLQLRRQLELPKAGAISHLVWAGSEQYSDSDGKHASQQAEVLVSRSSGPALLLSLQSSQWQALPFMCIGALLLCLHTNNGW